MDKQQKKKLKKKYLTQELEKEASGDDKILAYSAKAKLGIPLDEITIDKIQTWPDSYLELEMVNRIHYHIRKETRGRSAKTEADALRNLSKELRFIFFSNHLDGEVFNGGFEQYFSNSAGEYILETLDGYRLLGDIRIITILEKAIGVFIRMQNSYSDWILGELEPWTIKSAIIDKNYFIRKGKKSSLESLDDEYYRINKELSAKRINFIKKNAAIFAKSNRWFR
jgi:hypothetical protein